MVKMYNAAGTSKVIAVSNVEPVETQMHLEILGGGDQSREIDLAFKSEVLAPMFFTISDELESYTEPSKVRQGLHASRKALFKGPIKSIAIALKRGDWAVKFGTHDSKSHEVQINITMPASSAFRVNSEELRFRMYVCFDQLHELRLVDMPCELSDFGIVPF